MELTTITSALESGARAPDFKLPGTDGKQYSFATFTDKKILVLIFISNGCPTVKACEDRMINIQGDYNDKGVQLLAVNSNNEHLSPIDSFDEMVKKSRESHFNFPYVKDTDRTVARNYGATCTPHVFVLDEDHVLRYQGRIDDARNVSLVTVSDLRNALDDLTTGRNVRVPDTKPFGCSIVW